jgi:hypothetical protein
MLARLQLKLTEARLDEPFSIEQTPATLLRPLEATPAFIQPRSRPASRPRHTWNWLGAIAVAVVAPIAIGFVLGHPFIGGAFGAIGLIGVGLVAFGLDALNNTPPVF